MGPLMFTVYLALLLVILGLLVAGMVKAVRLMRGVSIGQTVLSEGETVIAFVAVAVLGLMIVGACLAIAGLIASA